MHENWTIKQRFLLFWRSRAINKVVVVGTPIATAGGLSGFITGEIGTFGAALFGAGLAASANAWTSFFTERENGQFFRAYRREKKRADRLAKENKRLSASRSSTMFSDARKQAEELDEFLAGERKSSG